MTNRTCPFCSSHTPQTARFVQHYRQGSLPAVPLSWLKCKACGGFWSESYPSDDEVAINWSVVPYQSIGEAHRKDDKTHLNSLVMSQLTKHCVGRKMIDLGCGYGALLSRAAGEGWDVYGLDPFPPSVDYCQKEGLRVQVGRAHDLDFSEKYDAISIIDAFCYEHQPLLALENCFNALGSGGVLAMRVSNKAALLKLSQYIPLKSPRNRVATKLLLDQYHSISTTNLETVLKSVGFSSVVYQGRAEATSVGKRSKLNRFSYSLADIVERVSGGKLQIHPAALVVAKKG